MSKYKIGDKVVLEIISGEAYGDYSAGSKEQNWWFNAEGLERGSEPIGTYTEPLEAKIRRQAAEITRLLAEKERLKAENEKMSVKIDAYELYGDQHEEEYNQAFNQGAEAAWELAKKIVLNDGYSVHDLYEIFDSHDSYHALENYTYQEAVAKVEAWERQKEEIKVGDVYKSLSGNFVVCGIDREKDMAKALWDDLSVGKIYLYEIKEQYTKTGRHIDIDSFLKQIGEE